MIGRTVRGALVAVALVAVPAAPAQACRFFDRCCGRPTTTFYAPVAVAPAPTCCAAPAPTCCARPTVVNYMPQTCYRTVYVNQPVTTYRPMSACGPCGATTVMRPVTTYVARPALVPYTTYRPVVTQMPAAQPCCSAPATTTYAPAVSVAPAAAPAPACCSPASATTVTPAPSLSSTYSQAPAATSVPSTSPSTTLTPTPTPSLNTIPQSSQPNRTFESSPSDVEQPQSRVLLPPRSSSSTRAHGLDPDGQDRTTAIPRRRTVHQASLVVPIKAAASQADDSGWRAAGQ